MRITAVDTVLLSWEMDEPLEYPPSRMTAWDNALIRIETDSGAVGWGEVFVSNSPHTHAELIPGYVDIKGRYLEGKELADIPLNAIGGGHGYDGRVNGGIELALWDLTAQSVGLPLHELLGSGTDTVRVYGSGGLGREIDQRIEQAHRYAERGFSVVKIRSFHEPEPTIRLVQQSFEQLDEDVSIALDAGPLRDRVPDAIRVGRALEAESERVAWYEDPVHPRNPAAFNRVREALTVPVSGMESLTGLDAIEDVLAADAVDIVHSEVTIVGGVRELQRVAALAATHDVSVVTHGWGGAVALLGNLHVAAAEANCDAVEFCQLPNPLRDEFLPDGFERDGDVVTLPDTPGLGVSIPDDVESRYPFSPPDDVTAGFAFGFSK